MTQDLDKRADELLADELTKAGRLNAAKSYRIGQSRHTPEWLLVRSLIEPPTDAKLAEIVRAWLPVEGPGGELNFFRFAFNQLTAPAKPEPTMEEVLNNMIVLAKPFFTDLTQIMALEQAQTALATLRAAGSRSNGSESGDGTMSEELERALLAFTSKPEWNENAVAPEDSAEWREGYEAAQDSLREILKPWWPFGGPLCLSPTPPEGDSEELKPCPFCGGKPEWRWHSGDALWLECSFCGMIGPQNEQTTDENNEATIAAWNTRPTPSEGDNEKLVEAEAAFADYFRRNYPGPDTIIGNPDWHSSRIFRAARSALAAKTSSAVEVERLREALTEILPGALCGEAWDLPEEETVQIVVTFGAIRRARAALTTHDDKKAER